ncbi:MAG: hypothetical protein WD512_03505, partial [Candidatus Paceibacterota bacterium]
MIKKLFCIHDDKAKTNETSGKTNETSGKTNETSDYKSIAKKAKNSILERKKEYAKNLGDWIEAYAKDNLHSKALKAAKRGVTTFELCRFERETCNWYGKTLWLFTGFEMNGGFSAKFWYNDCKKYRYGFKIFEGAFFNVNTYLVERCEE